LSLWGCVCRLEINIYSIFNNILKKVMGSEYFQNALYDMWHPSVGVSKTQG
jgi:hypothetical protein